MKRLNDKLLVPNIHATEDTFSENNDDAIFNFASSVLQTVMRLHGGFWNSKTATDHKVNEHERFEKWARGIVKPFLNHLDYACNLRGNLPDLHKADKAIMAGNFTFHDTESSGVLAQLKKKAPGRDPTESKDYKGE